MTDLLPLVFTSGWASGVNAYAVVLVLGLLGRFAGVDVVPSALQSDAVLIGAAVLYALEFVADKASRARFDPAKKVGGAVSAAAKECPRPSPAPTDD